MTPDQAKLAASPLANCGGLRHGFFTRQGGVSGGIYGSLNCGLGSRDGADNVAENRARVAEVLGVASDRLLTLYQVHSAEAVIVETPWANGKAPEADAIVTRTPRLAIGALTADCAPVLFCDRQARVIGAAHAGWRGALSGIVEATVAAMEELGAAGLHVIGISPDAQEKLIQFRAKESVGFPLLSDPNRSTLDAYGAFGEKLLYGKLIKGVIRSTFVIDVDQKGEGTIAVAQYNVKAAGHVDKLKRDLHL